MLKNYFKIAWRNIISHKKITLINLTGLTVGMTAAFLIFMWVKNEYSYDSYHPDAENIYRLTTYAKKDGAKRDERTPFILGEEVKNQLPGIMVARIYPLNVFAPTIQVGEDLFKEKAATYVDENWFNMFRFDFLKGNARTFNSTVNGVVISAAAAEKYFGSEDVIGKIMRINDIDCTIEGVVRNYPANSSFRYDVFVSNTARKVRSANRNRYTWAYSYQTYIKLPPVAPNNVIGRINTIPDADWKANYTIGLIALQNIHFENDLDFSALPHGDKKTTGILFMLGILLLVVACINYINLTTAKATSRIKEVSIKKIIGANRKQLFFQFITESAMICVIVLFVTLLLVKLSLPVFNSFTNNHFNISLTNASLWQLVGATLLAAMILNSLYPAVLLSSFKPIAMLQGDISGKLKGSLLRKMLVIAQFSISIALIIGTLVMYRQMQFINKQYDNYDKSQLFSFAYPAADDATKQTEMETVLHQLEQQSSISDAAISSFQDIINIQNVWDGFDWNGHNKDIHYEITFMPVGLNFNKLARFQLKEGRWFTPNKKAEEKNFILNETAVNELGMHQPVIGQRFSLDKDTGVVVGVVKDFHYLGLRKKIGAVVIGNNPWYNNSFIVKSMPGKQAAALLAVQKIWKKFLPGQPFDYQFASTEFEQLYRNDRQMESLICVFSLIVIFISCLGLYALALFNVVRRNKEIGIRKVLGASVAKIVQTLSSDFIKLVLISIFIASPVSWLIMNKWLQAFAYRVEIQWWLFAVAALLAIFLAFITISFQTVKAALTNPVKSLRNE